MYKYILFIFGLIFAQLFVSNSYAQTRAQCNFEWRVCKASGPTNYASECWEPNGICNEKANLNVTPEKTVCYNEYKSCIYNSCGSFGDSDIVPCARRCLRKEQTCQKTSAKPTPTPRYIPPPQPTYTPPTSNTNTVQQSKSSAARSVTDILGAISGQTNDSSESNDFIQRATDCQQQGGTMLDGSCVDKLQSSDASTEDNIRKKLGTDLETMKAVSDLGGRNARTCVGARTDQEGWLYIKNICGKSVNFGYCYDKWVPKRTTATNPFKCDSTGKLAWGGASSVRGSDDWRAPLQADSISRKLIFGACMSEVFYNNRKYSYLHSKRTSAAFRGGSGKYKCIYIKSAGQK